MIYILLGIIIGLILACIWLTILLILPDSIRSLPKTISDSLIKRNRPRGAIIDAPSDEELAISQKLKRNRELGIDTRLEDL